MEPEPNVYSRQWFEFFHAGIDEARTIREEHGDFATNPARNSPIAGLRGEKRGHVLATLVTETILA
jgi:hypothetical protein